MKEQLEGNEARDEVLRRQSQIQIPNYRLQQTDTPSWRRRVCRRSVFTSISCDNGSVQQDLVLSRNVLKLQQGEKTTESCEDVSSLITALNR